MGTDIAFENIKKILSGISPNDLLSSIELAFVHYSKQQAVVPPVGTLSFDNPRGDVHIKYGYILDDDYYVIKIASGFYDNPKLRLPSSNGMMLAFNQRTGILEGILYDQGYLTDVRTAVAGAISAKFMAPDNVHTIGIMGTGTQAKMQLQHLKGVVDCSNALVWGRSEEKLGAYQEAMKDSGFQIEITMDAEQIAEKCQLIVTTTPANEAILQWSKHLTGVHITAMGADTIGKQELDLKIVSKADLVVVDSIKQCTGHGEIHKAFNQHLVETDSLIELGQVIEQGKIDRKENDLTICDLTGIATQDIQITKLILENR